MFKSCPRYLMVMENYKKFLEILGKLRGENGCQWDREQTLKSLRKELMSEAQELSDAIDKEDHEELKEEIGDLIWVATHIAKVAEEKGIFTFDDVLKAINEKMVRRHPHVFGNKKANDVEDAKRLYYEAKANEKNHKFEKKSSKK